MQRLPAWALACLLVACSSKSPAPVRRGTSLLELQEEQAQGREVVAKVNGRPIYSDCVKRQAESHALSRKQALDECIDFELLAQAASTPEYQKHPEVQERTKQELVRRFVLSQYPLKSPQDIPMALVQQLWQQMSPRRYNRPALRNFVYCRVPPSSDEQARAAKRFFAKLYSELKTKSGLTKVDLFTACYGQPGDEAKPRPYQVAGIETLKLETFRLSARQQVVPAFQTPLFDGTLEAGMVAPPLQTEYGWDLILVTEAKEAVSTELAEVEEELREALFRERIYEDHRAELFADWYQQFGEQHQVTRHDERLPAPTQVLEAGPAQ